MADIIVDDPRTGKALYTITEPTEADVAQVYDRAAKAFQTFSSMTVPERLRELGKLKRYILDNKEHIVDRIVEETGKCRMDALTLEVFAALDVISYYEKNAAKLLADEKVSTPIILTGKKSRTFFEPLGTVLVISPWNYPFHLSFIPIVCALVAGNAVILKPSRYTPLKGVIEDMVEKSGFVKDALQVVYATRNTAKALIDAKPAKIFFTGSVGGGRQVMKAAAEHLIPVELELGGKDPMVVFDDVNLDRTVNGALWGGFTNCGQTCVSVERIYVQESIHDQFVAALKDKAARLRTLIDQGNAPDELDLDVGSMTAEFQIDEIEAQLADAEKKGAKIIAGGGRVPGTRILPPTILTGVDHSMAIAMDETFGPVVTVTKFKTEDEAVKLANDSPFGLAASVWSADIDRAVRVARRIKTGSVSINNVLATQANPALPFGGAKESGFGRYRGPYGLHAFSNIKAVMIDKQSGNPEMYWFPYSKKKYAMIGKLTDGLFGGGLAKFISGVVMGLKLESMAKKERL
jgi:acyl-CoA reductase-like NAD-dependent aldehyde dehydrogenase